MKVERIKNVKPTRGQKSIQFGSELLLRQGQAALVLFATLMLKVVVINSDYVGISTNRSSFTGI